MDIVARVRHLDFSGALGVALAFAVVATAGMSTAAAQQDGEDGPSQEATEKEKARKVLHLIRKGKKAYKAKEFQAALKHFQKAYQLKPNPSILVPLGRTSEQLGEDRQAIEYYRKYLDKKPDNEKVARRVERLRSGLPATVTIRSTPEGATVRRLAQTGETDDETGAETDAKSLGTTPLEAELEPGKHTLVFAAEGYQSVEKTVTLEGDGQRELAVTLEKIPPKPTPEPAAGGKRADRGALAMWGWGTSAVGVAGLGTGIVLSLMANSAENKVNSFDRGASGASRGELEDLKSTARGRYRSSIVAYSAGGALTLAGVGMLTYHFLRKKQKEQGPVGWRLDGGIGADGAWAGFQARF